MERYIGETISMPDPDFGDVQIVWMTQESWLDTDRRNCTYPSVWFIFGGEMYHGLSKYRFMWFEQYEDWLLPSEKQFDCYFPGKEEWEYMTHLGLEYRKLDYEKAMQGDMDEWCDFELEFAKKWNREKKIEELLKTKNKE